MAHLSIEGLMTIKSDSTSSTSARDLVPSPLNRGHEIGVTAPRISVGLPVYNGENFLGAAIQSVLDQDYPDLELVIADNASDDRTRTICEEFVRIDPRVRYYRRQENAGAARNYNDLFHLARGEFFKWAAHDDIVGRDFLRRAVEAFESGPPDLVLVHSLSTFIDASGNPICEDHDRQASMDYSALRRSRTILREMFMAGAVFGLFRRTFLAKTPLIAPYIASDCVLLYEASLRGKVLQLPFVGFYRRLHDKVSRVANSSATDVNRWFDPDAPPVRGEHWILFKAYLRCLLRVGELGLFARIGCAAVVTQHSLSRAIKRVRIRFGAWRRRVVADLRAKR
jgi:glycosyltransferase involved in cell wall biosynthesis